jgi:hypothetical protein
MARFEPGAGAKELMKKSPSWKVGTTLEKRHHDIAKRHSITLQKT